MEYTLAFDLINAALIVSHFDAGRLVADAIPVEEDLLRCGEYVAALETGLSGYISASGPFEESANVTVLLPDSSVCIDYISVPNLGRRATTDALNVEIAKLYKSSENLVIRTGLLETNRRSMQFQIVAVLRELTEKLRQTVENCGLTLRLLSFAASAAAGVLLTGVPRLKDRAFLFADVGPDATELLLLGKNRLLGFSSMPAGSTLLLRDSLAEEESIFRHASAMRAVESAYCEARASGRQPKPAACDEPAENEEPVGSSTIVAEDLRGEDLALANFSLLEKRIQLCRMEYIARGLLQSGEPVLLSLPEELRFIAERADGTKAASYQFLELQQPIPKSARGRLGILLNFVPGADSCVVKL